jgi:hypothetical protein
VKFFGKFFGICLTGFCICVKLDGVEVAARLTAGSKIFSGFYIFQLL